MRVIAEENMENYFNADTVYVYDVPLLKPYKGIYKECIGINMVKEGHPFGMIKVLLADGCDAKDKYMKQLFKSIRYSDSIPDYKARMKPKNYKRNNHEKVYPLFVSYPVGSLFEKCSLF